MNVYNLATILSVITGRPFADANIIHSMLDYMMGRQLNLMEFSAAMKTCKKSILKQYPKLKEITKRDAWNGEIKLVLARLINKYGNEFVIYSE